MWLANIGGFFGAAYICEIGAVVQYGSTLEVIGVKACMCVLMLVVIFFSDSMYL